MRMRVNDGVVVIVFVFIGAVPPSIGRFHRLRVSWPGLEEDHHTNRPIKRSIFHHVQLN